MGDTVRLADAFPASPVTVSLGDLQLRAHDPADADRLVDASDDDAMRRWNPLPDDPQELADWIARRADWSEATHLSWAIAAADGSLLGAVSLHHLDLNQRDAEIGYWVAPWARRRGVARRAVNGAIDFAVKRVALHRLYLFHAVDNEASCGVARAVGMRLEGELRSSYRYGDGRYHDEHLHAVLADERRQAGR